MSNSIIGFHIRSNGNGKIRKKIEEAIKLKCGYIQMFITKSVSYAKLPFSSNDLKYYDNNKDKIKIIVHGSYIINLARNWDEFSWWIRLSIHEFNIAKRINPYGIVVHMGKRKDLDVNIALNNMYTSLLYILNKTKNKKTMLLLETPAGQGTEICWNIESFGNFYKKILENFPNDVSNRIKICIDTCHIFSAGYDIRTNKKVNLFYKLIDKYIGWINVGLIHLNDSKYKLGSKVDAHVSLGDGYIGWEGIRAFACLANKHKIPIILETPGTYKKEISIIRNFTKDKNIV